MIIDNSSVSSAFQNHTASFVECVIAKWWLGVGKC